MKHNKSSGGNEMIVEKKLKFLEIFLTAVFETY
jgi:hypothetical protein